MTQPQKDKAGHDIVAQTVRNLLPLFTQALKFYEEKYGSLSSHGFDYEKVLLNALHQMVFELGTTIEGWSIPWTIKRIHNDIGWKFQDIDRQSTDREYKTVSHFSYRWAEIALFTILDYSGLFEKHKTSTKRGRYYYTILPTQEFQTLLLSLGKSIAQGVKFRIPMLIPPIPWFVGPDNRGGYLHKITNQDNCVVLNTKSKQHYEHYCNYDNIQPCVDAINYLQTIPLQLNKEMVDVVLDLHRNPRLPKWQRPSCMVDPFAELPIVPEVVVSQNIRATKKSKLKRLFGWRIRRQRIARRVKQAIAVEMLDRVQKLSVDKLYIPYKADFRGRIYGLPTYSKPQEMEYIRAAYQFHDGFEANIDQNYETFMSYGRRIYGGHNVRHDFDPTDLESLHADKPLLFMAWQKEYTRLVVNRERDTRLPIQIDASANAFQHIAMLTKCKQLAEYVNLGSSSQRQDLYQFVGREALIKISADEKAATGYVWTRHEQPPRELIKVIMLNNMFGNNVVHTSDAIQRMIFRSPELQHKYYGIGEYSLLDIGQSCNELTRKTIIALYELFPIIPQFISYIKEAVRIAFEREITIKWRTPTNFVVYPCYYKQLNKHTANIRKFTIRHKYTIDKTNKRAYTNTIISNVIHSLDASHLQMIVKECENNSIPLFTNHDSFYTPLPFVDILKKIYKDTLVEMYQNKYVLENIYANICDVYELFPHGDFDYNKILRNQYACY